MTALPPVQMLWVEGPLSTLERLSIRSFLHAGHPVHLYHYGPIPNAPSGTSLKDARTILHNDKLFRAKAGVGRGTWTLFSNLFRYRLLRDHGGIWSDTDVVCLRPLEFAPRRPYFFASERMPPQPGQSAIQIKVASCILQAPAGCELMIVCDRKASEICDSEEVHWGAAGPELLTAEVRAQGLTEYVVQPELFCPIDYWNIAALISGPTTVIGDVHCVHFWNEMWRRNFLDKDAEYDRLSLYERLKSRFLSEARMEPS